MEAAVYQQDGSEAGRSVELDASVFGIEPNDHVLWLDVRRIQAAGRQGTHKTKERNEVRGSRRKLYRQKGTGHARAGDAKSPIRKTGGRAHGPRPRSYDLKLNKKTRQLARRSALSYKAQADAVRVVEDFSFDTPSTRAVIDLLGQMEATGKVLVLTAEHDAHIYTSAQNLGRVQVREARNVSTLDVLQADLVVIQEGGLDILSQMLRPGEPVEA